MEKLVFSIKKRLLCIVLSVSMVCSTTATTTYQAAAIPVVYTGWQVLVTVLALLGICISAAPDYSDDEATQELVDAYLGWRVLKGEGQGDNDGDGKDDVYATFDPLDWLIGDELTVPEEEMQLLQQFVSEHIPQLPFTPVSDLDLYNCTYQEFLDFYCGLYNFDLNDSNVDVYLNKVFDRFDNNYCGVFTKVTNDYTYSHPDYTYYAFYHLVSAYDYAMCLVDDVGTYYLRQGSSNMKNYWLLSYSPDGVTSHSSTKTSIYVKPQDEKILIINGRLYDFDTVFSLPANVSSGVDYGPKINVSNFEISTNNFSESISDSVNKIDGVDFSELILNGNFDVIGGGRDYDSDKQQATGDITVPMPSGDVLTDYQNGLITYEQLLDKLGLTPIDESTGTNLITQELLNTNTGILSGIDKLVDFVSGLFEGLVEMFLSLFIPSPGFFQNYFTQLDEFLTDKLGVLYLPVDLLIDILNAFVSADKSDTTLHFPGVVFQEYVIIPEQDVNLDVSGRFPFLQSAAHFITNAILTFGLVIQLRSKLREVMKR